MNKDNDEIIDRRKYLADKIEIKDHYIDENGQKKHYSMREMELLIRAKYMPLNSMDSAEFINLDIEILENIISQISYLERKIPDWRTMRMNGEEEIKK